MERETLQVPSALSSTRMWQDRRPAADNPFHPIPTAGCHGRFLRWQQWFLFAARADPV